MSEISVQHRLTLSRCLTPLFVLSALAGIYLLSRYKYNLFHSLADGVTIVIAACAFTIIWNSRRSVDNNFFLFVGISFLFFAILDLMHLLGNKGMGVFPEYGNLGPAFYIASRYVLSISLLIAPLFINRKLNTVMMLAVYSLGTLLILLSILYWRTFPICIIEGVGLTPFKVISDYIICLILLGAIGALILNRREFDGRVLRIIVSSLILSIATGLTFTLYTDPFGVSNMFGHLFQLASFYLIYIAFIETLLTKPQEILFRKLMQHEETLTANLQQLDKANAELKQEMAERRRVEEALKRSNQELQQFAYAASHDLQEPLRAITGFLQLLQGRYGEKIDAKGRHYIERTVRAGHRMQEMIRDLLNLSRVSNDEQKIVPVDPNRVVREVREDLQRIIQEKNADIVCGNLPVLEGDPGQIKSLFQNLVLNGLRYNQSSRPVIEIGSHTEDNVCRIFIRDNGIGIDPKFYQRIFMVFQRLHANSEYSGTGMGLALCKKIVERHGGTIWVESEPGQGATFYFTLPINRC